MDRRQFLTGASATVAAASIPGCSGILGGDGGDGGGGNSSPDAAVQAYVNAVNSNDAEGAEDVEHPDGSGSGGVSNSNPEEVSLSIDSMEVVEQSDGRATVEAEIGITFSSDEEESTETRRFRFDVREHEGEWLIYGSTEISSEN